MARKTINFGRYPNDRKGTGVRKVNDAINNNFEELYNGVGSLLVATGTDTYAVQYNEDEYTAYTAGDKFLVQFTNANTGASTLNVNGLGAKAIQKANSADLGSGDIPAGKILLLVYNGTAFTAAIVLSGSPELDSPLAATTGGTITLDFISRTQRMFVGSAPFTGSKITALLNNTNAKVFNLHIEITTSCTLTMPSTFTMTDPDRWNSSTKVLTITGTGKYELSGTFDGVKWKIKCSPDGGYL